MDTKQLYDFLDKSPMFKLSLSSKELFHSNFLEYLSSVDPMAFKGLIKKMAGVPDMYNWPEEWQVKREYHNFDLCIVERVKKKDVSDYDAEKDDGSYYDNQDGVQVEESMVDYRILFVIENKVKSIPYEEQLKRYKDEANELNDSFFSKMAKQELEDATKVIRANGIWYKRNKDSRWLMWSGPSGQQIWSELTKSPDLKSSNTTIDSLKRTDFYNDYINEKKKQFGVNYILLSLAEEFPDRKPDSSDDLCEWRIVHYPEYAIWINEYYKATINQEKDLNGLVIKDYCDFIKNLSELTKKWEATYEDKRPFLYFYCDKHSKKTYYPDYKKAQEYRIHDLYQKLKFSYLCTGLYRYVEKEYNSIWKVFPSNKNGLFNDKSRFEAVENYICVNYTYLHGDPLLEINIHPKVSNGEREYYYTIQVQGDSYERGIQVKAKEKEQMDAVNAWTLLKNRDIKIIDKWIALDEEDDWGFPEKNGSSSLLGELERNKDKGYYKFDTRDKTGTYIYQKRKIKSSENRPNIKEIIGLMKMDLYFVLINYEEPIQIPLHVIPSVPQGTVDDHL